MPRPPFAPRPRPFPGVKVRLSKSPKHKAVHNPQPNPTAFTSATKGACHLFVLSKKNAGTVGCFGKVFRDMSTPEVGTSKVDIGKTPSETRCSLVIAPKTLDLRVQLGMLLDVSSHLHQYILQIRQILCSIFRGIGELRIWTCWTFVLHLFVSSWRPIIILSSVLAPTILFGYQTQTNKHYQPRNYSLCISSIAPGRELLLQRIQPKERATTHN